MMAEPRDVAEWGTSPAFWSHAKVFIRFIRNLTPVKDVPGAFAHHARPV